MRNATASLSGAVKYAASSAEEGNAIIPVNKAFKNNKHISINKYVSTKSYAVV